MNTKSDTSGIETDDDQGGVPPLLLICYDLVLHITDQDHVIVTEVVDTIDMITAGTETVTETEET